MHKTIQVPDLEQTFRAVLEEVKREHIPYVVTEDSRPEAVLVPYDEFLKLQRFQEEKILTRFDEIWRRMALRNVGFREEEVAQDIAVARNERSKR